MMNKKVILINLIIIIISMSHLNSALTISPSDSEYYYDFGNLVLATTVNENRKLLNELPIIGILTQEVSRLIQRKYPGQNYKSYVAASYVKFIESAGGRVVPIWIGQSRSYYELILSKINGVLLPGGATFFNQTNGYADAGKHIYEIAKQINDNGTLFPIWGTCLGFELMAYLSANGTEIRSDCNSQSQALPLEFKEGFKKSRLFGSASDNIINILQNENVTANFHQFCITEKTLENYNLQLEWNILSLGHDWNNFEFISIMEHRKYPFYGVQFHPEKNNFEFVLNRNLTHSANAILACQYFANFFINETRYNFHKFPTQSEENNRLIYNYSPMFTAKKGSVFLQQYLFDQLDVEFIKGTEDSKSDSNSKLYRMPIFLIAILSHAILKLNY